MTTTRLRAAIDALAAAVPDGALMAATDPADFLLDVRCRLATAEERAERAERERDEARLRSCQCGAEEACRYARERDKARALADTYREELRLANTEAARLREGNAALRDNIESCRDRLATIIDEEWGTQPWMDLSTLLSALGKRLFADRLERERYRRAVERIASVGVVPPCGGGCPPDAGCAVCLARAALEAK
jgi:hypothetical protein